MTMTEIAKALTGDDVQRVTGGRIKKKTLDHWRMIGKGPKYFRVGRRVLYRQQDIESFAGQED